MTGLHHGWGHDKSDHADFRHGAVDPKDFDEPVPYKKKRGKKNHKKKAGCPGNDGKAHVYVWVTETRERPVYVWGPPHSGFIHTYTVELKKCCGCDKIAKRKVDWNTYFG